MEQNQENNQQQENSSDSNQQESQPVSEQPTNQPQPRVYTEQEVRTIHELYGQTLRENEQRLQAALQAQQNTNNQSVNNNQQRNPQDDDFLSNGRNIVGEEIDRRLQPFSQWMQQQQSQTMYSQLKDTFKRHPTFSAFFNIPQAEVLLDQQALQIPAANMNTQTLAGLISQIYGYMQLNNMIPQQPIATVNNQPMANNTQFQQPVNNQPVNNNLPPHLRPSAPPMPNNNGQNLTAKGNVRRPLTELERRVAREQGFKNDDDYIDFLNESPNNVAFTDIGRAK